MLVFACVGPPHPQKNNENFFNPGPVNFDVSFSVDFVIQKKFPGRPYRAGREAAITVQSYCGGGRGVPETHFLPI
jgi:hypothetical protein